MILNKQYKLITQLDKSTTLWTAALALLFTLSMFSNDSFAANGVNVNSSNVAISGYDTVAYFTQSKAIKGKNEFIAEHQGNKWKFSSFTNKKLFLANPTAYLPQYGGFCAYAASKNSIAKIDPEAWSIHNNKLYLNYNNRIRNTWLKKKVKRIVEGDRYWPELMKKVIEPKIQNNK